jgi:hypothetical protein
MSGSIYLSNDNNIRLVQTPKPLRGCTTMYKNNKLFDLDDLEI